MTPPFRAGSSPPLASTSTEPVWLTLTELGRIYGISAVHCGRLLSAAGLRGHDGEATSQALQAGCAIRGHHPRSHGPTHWHRQHCQSAFAAAGLKPVQRRTLVQQWAELLSALTEGSPSISTSADQMAEELPSDLVEPVNAELRQIGCSFQVGSGSLACRPQSKARRREERGTCLPL